MRNRSGFVRYASTATVLVLLVAFLSGYTQDVAVRRFLRLSSEEIRSGVCEGEEFDRVKAGSYGPRPNVVDPVVLVTAKFGKDDKFHGEVARHASCLARAGPFDVSDMYVYSSFPEFITEDPRWERHLRFLEDEKDDSAKGAGFGFWKPALILHHLESLPEGGVLVFADSSRVDFAGWLAKLIQAMMDSRKDLALEQFGRSGMDVPERSYTKGDVYDKFSVESMDDSAQYNANYMVVRKNEDSMQFMRDWVEAVEDFHLLSDEPSNRPNHESFVEHRNEQSILSMLLKHKWKEPRKRIFHKRNKPDVGPVYGPTYMFNLSDNGADSLAGELVARKRSALKKDRYQGSAIKP